MTTRVCVGWQAHGPCTGAATARPPASRAAIRSTGPGHSRVHRHLESLLGHWLIADADMSLCAVAAGHLSAEPDPRPDNSLTPGADQPQRVLQRASVSLISAATAVTVDPAAGHSATDSRAEFGRRLQNPALRSMYQKVGMFGFRWWAASPGNNARKAVRCAAPATCATAASTRSSTSCTPAASTATTIVLRTASRAASRRARRRRRPRGIGVSRVRRNCAGGRPAATISATADAARGPAGDHR